MHAEDNVMGCSLQKASATYISHEGGVRAREAVALYCGTCGTAKTNLAIQSIVLCYSFSYTPLYCGTDKTKWAIRLSTRLSPSTNLDPPTPA